MRWSPGWTARQASAQRIERSSGDAMARFDSTAGQLTQQFEHVNDTITSRLIDTAEKLTEHLGTTSAALTGRLADTTSQIADQIDQVSGNLATRLDGTAERVTGRLDQSSEELANHLEQTTARFTHQLESVSGTCSAASTRLARGSQAPSTPPRAAWQTGWARRPASLPTGSTRRLSNSTVGCRACRARSPVDWSGRRARGRPRSTRRPRRCRAAWAPPQACWRSSSSAPPAICRSASTAPPRGWASSSTACGRPRRPAGRDIHPPHRAAQRGLQPARLGTRSRHRTAYDRVEAAHASVTERFQSTSSDLAKTLETVGNPDVRARRDHRARPRRPLRRRHAHAGAGDSRHLRALRGQQRAVLQHSRRHELAHHCRAQRHVGQLRRRAGGVHRLITGRFEQTAGALVEPHRPRRGELETRGQSTSQRLDEAGTKFAGHIEQANVVLGERLSEAAKGLDSELEDAMNTLSTRLETTSGKVGNRLEEASATVERAVGGLQHRHRAGDPRPRGAAQRTGGPAWRQDRRRRRDDGASTRPDRGGARSGARPHPGSGPDAGRAGRPDLAAAAGRAAPDRGFGRPAGGAAAKTMREQYETVLASMGEMLATSSQSFGQTAQEMRATAEQVVRGHRHARSELKRTILELPDETRANADAMRQVVSDQITALSALSDVVKRQSGLMELSGPGVKLLPSNGGPARENLRAPRPLLRRHGRPAPRMKGSGAPATRRARQWQRRDGARPAGRPLAPGRAAPRRHRQPAATAGGRRGRQRRSSWRARPKSWSSKLNGIARDLVRALDGKLDEELERRFGAGEEHVYTHRLYLARRKLQSEIATRYGQEPPVRGHADGFVKLFERLLERRRRAAGPGAGRCLPRLGKRQGLPHAGPGQRWRHCSPGGVAPA
jgi:ABC-type transporter Mla subunit MlaD